MALDQAGQQYANIVAQDTGLAQPVVDAWVASESNPTSQGARANNWLNIGPGYSYSSIQAGADAAGALIRQSPDYSGIRSSVGQPPVMQVAAISASPWDGGHYNNGLNLTNTYNSMNPGGKLTLQDVQVAMLHFGYKFAGNQVTPSNLTPQQKAQAIQSGQFDTGAGEGCAWQLSLGPINTCVVSKSQGRALLGGVCLAAGGGLLILGLALIAGADRKVITIAKGALGGAAGGPGGAAAGAAVGATKPTSDDAELAYYRQDAQEHRRLYDEELQERRDRAQARRESALAGRLERERSSR